MIWNESPSLILLSWSEFIFVFYFCFVCFLGRASLRSLGWPCTHRNPASRVLSLPRCVTLPGILLFLSSSLSSSWSSLSSLLAGRAGHMCAVLWCIYGGQRAHPADWTKFSHGTENLTQLSADEHSLWSKDLETVMVPALKALISWALTGLIERLKRAGVTGNRLGLGTGDRTYTKAK